MRRRHRMPAPSLSGVGASRPKSAEQPTVAAWNVSAGGSLHQHGHTPAGQDGHANRLPAERAFGIEGPHGR